MVALSRPRWWPTLQICSECKPSGLLNLLKSIALWLAINILNSTKTLKAQPTQIIINPDPCFIIIYPKNPKKAKESFRNQRTLSMKHSMDITILCFTASPHHFTHLPSVHQSIRPVPRGPGASQESSTNYAARILGTWQKLVQITPPAEFFWNHWKSFFLRLFVAVKIGAPVLPLSRCLMPRLEPTSRPAIQSDLVASKGQKTMSSKEGNKKNGPDHILFPPTALNQQPGLCKTSHHVESKKVYKHFARNKNIPNVTHSTSHSMPTVVSLSS